MRSRRKLLGIFFIGIASGLPFPLTQSTLIIWLKEAGFSNDLIGFLSIVSLPYMIKPLWSPIVDIYNIPILKNYFSLRKSWLLCTQGILILLILLLGIIKPDHHLLLFISLTFILAIASATQDLVVDAYRIEVLSDSELPNGVANTLLGYRLGLLISTGVVLFLAEISNWTTAYFTVALFLFIVGFSGLLLMKDHAPTNSQKKASTFLKDLKRYIIRPLALFLQKNGGLLLLLFIFFFKVPDTFLKVMNDIFFIEAGFNKIEIASIGKIYGTLCSMIGLYLGALSLKFFKLKNALWLAILIQPISNLILFLEFYFSNNISILTLMVTVEQLGVGISTSILVTFLSKITDKNYAATHYAILSSLAGLGAMHLSMPAGYIAKEWGWPMFIFCSVLTAIPAILIYFQISRKKMLQHFSNEPKIN